MLFWELKLFICDYKKIVIIFLILLTIIMSIFKVSTVLEKRGYLFEPFTVGVINNDNSKYIEAVFNVYKGNDTLSKTINFQVMDEQQCKNEFASGEIPAYIILPKDFTKNINTGVNTPVILVGNKSKALQVNVVKFVINAGISFLTTSQSGIYSTIDYSKSIGLSDDVINNSIVMPINLKYAMALLGYNNYFKNTVVSSTGNLTLLQYYGISFYVFFIMLISTAFMSNIFSGTKKSVLLMYSKSKKRLPVFALYKIISLTIVLTLISLPVFYLLGLRVIAICFLVSLFVFFISTISDSLLVANVLLIFSSFILIYISGGIVPTIYLPKIFNILAKFTPNYYLLNLHNKIDIFCYVVCAVIFFVVSNILLFRRSCK